MGAKQWEHVHLSQVDDLTLLRNRVDFHDTKRGANSQCTIQDIDTEDYRVALGEARDGLQAARPNRLWRSVLTLSLHDLSIIGSEGVEKMVDDVGCQGVQ